MRDTQRQEANGNGQRTTLKILLCLTLSLSFLNSCAKKEDLYTPSKAEKDLVAFCLKEGKIDVTTRRVGNAQWIYVPLEESLFKFQSTPAGKKDTTPQPFSLLSFSGEFDEKKQFSFIYDIVPETLPPDPITYGTNYNENFTRKRQLISQALTETFLNLEQDAPEFLVTVIADITSGIALKSTAYFKDFAQYSSQTLPPDEYILREDNKIIGEQKLVGDRTGRGLDYQPVIWSDFLVKQIENRARFAFTQSDFPPQNEVDKFIAGIAANTLRYYPFSEYEGLHLLNWRNKSEAVFNKNELTAMEKPLKEGKYHRIQFDMSKGFQLDEDVTPPEQNSSLKEEPSDWPQTK